MKIFLSLFLLSGFALTPNGYAESNWHETWTTLLSDHVQNGLVNYKSIKSEPTLLNNYLDKIEALEENVYSSWDENEKIAFWINVYNAAVLKVIINHYPIKTSLFKSFTYPKNSIQQIPDVWDKSVITVMGKDYSLNNIEHDVLRKNFKKPRIHMALVCAAKSCPPLREEAYVGEKLDDQLEDQSQVFLNNSNNLRWVESSRTLYLSSIFDWFGDDFIAIYPMERKNQIITKETAVISFIQKTIPEYKEIIQNPAATKIQYQKYDWELNELNSR